MAAAAWALTVFALIFTIYVWIRFAQQKPFIRVLAPSHSAFSTQQAAADKAPFVSIIVAARNEESSIRSTLQSLQNLHYAQFEIIVVNDRSTDSTGAEIDAHIEEARHNGPSMIQAVHLKELPGGWLGKNHALYQGYLRAGGELLLFTDADIRFHPETLAAAVREMAGEHADHVTVSPRMLTRTFILGAFVRFFLYSLGLFTEPWFANDDRRRSRSIGIGAFNLITRGAYESIGTHRALAFRPDDDLRLGKLVKESGGTQRFLSGEGMLEVEWYPGLGDAVRGLEKNLFSGFRYRYGMAAFALFGQLAVFVLPLPLALWIWPSWPAAGSLFSVYVLQSLLCAFVVRDLSGTDRRRVWLEALFHPVSALILAYVICRSVALTGWRGGIYWRGTFYSLDELRRSD
jgi:cellulose synthase/poly-beta-1,6-N-acetylglucosamine synthase-like glycosyltransferase